MHSGRLLSLATILGSGLLLCACATTPATPAPGMRSFTETLQDVHRNYVDAVESRVLLEKAMQGLLKESGQSLASVGVPPAALALGEERRAVGQEEIPFSSLRAFTQLYAAIKARDRTLDDMKLFEGAIRGMLSGLDERSEYVPPETARELRQPLGRTAAIGAELAKRNGTLQLVAPLEDSPAAKIGLRPGDAILTIDGKSTSELSLSQAVLMLRGTAGSSVLLSVQNTHGEQVEYRVVREIIDFKAVSGRLIAEHIAYVRISSFHRGVVRELGDLLDKLGSEKPLRGLILDLRNNPGGILNEVVRVADVFIAEGLLVSLNGRTEESRMRFSARPGGPQPVYENLPLVVLVNGATAAGAEIITASLQDHRRALIVGSGTFGLVSVQTAYPLSEGGVLKLTTARYMRPAGVALDNKGINPDVCLARNQVPVKNPVGTGASKTCPSAVRIYKQGEPDEEVEYASRHLLAATQKVVRQKNK